MDTADVFNYTDFDRSILLKIQGQSKLTFPELVLVFYRGFNGKTISIVEATEYFRLTEQETNRLISEVYKVSRGFNKIYKKMSNLDKIKSIHATEEFKEIYGINYNEYFNA